MKNFLQADWRLAGLVVDYQEIFAVAAQIDSVNAPAQINLNVIEIFIAVKTLLKNLRVKVADFIQLNQAAQWFDGDFFNAFAAVLKRFGAQQNFIVDSRSQLVQNFFDSPI